MSCNRCVGCSVRCRLRGLFVFGHVQALLEVVNDLFEEQTDLEKIVRKIMHRAQTLLKCERCSVQLLEDIESPVHFKLHTAYWF